jgi:hypothetical protein
MYFFTVMRQAEMVFVVYLTKYPLFLYNILRRLTPLRKPWQIAQEERMTNRKILLGMLVIGLVFGFMVIGCGDDSSDDENSFKGSWSGTFTPKVSGVEGDEIDATISLTDTTWALNAGNIRLNGTYTKSTTYSATLTIQSIPIGLAVVNPIALNSTLTVTIYAGAHPGSGSFKSGASNIQSDSFKGTWTGTFTPSAGNETSATITFTDDTWTLGPVGIAQNGTYTKTTIGYTATLLVQGLTVGTAVLNPISGNLTVKIVASPTGSGSFQRQP